MQSNCPIVYPGLSPFESLHLYDNSNVVGELSEEVDIYLFDLHGDLCHGEVEDVPLYSRSNVVMVEYLFHRLIDKLLGLVDVSFDIDGVKEAERNLFGCSGRRAIRTAASKKEETK